MGRVREEEWEAGRIEREKKARSNFIRMVPCKIRHQAEQ